MTETFGKRHAWVNNKPLKVEDVMTVPRPAPPDKGLDAIWNGRARGDLGAEQARQGEREGPRWGERERPSKSEKDK